MSMTRKRRGPFRPWMLAMMLQVMLVTWKLQGDVNWRWRFVLAPTLVALAAGAYFVGLVTLGMFLRFRRRQMEGEFYE